MLKIINNKKAFTLVELLVVISIIGILSSFAVVSLNSARVKARDALRKGDMAQIRTALALYYMENNRYPICGTWEEGESNFGATIGDEEFTGSDCYINELKDGLTAGTRPIMQQIPFDPMNKDNLAATNGTYIYRYVSDTNGTQYAVVYTLEDDGSEVVFMGW